MGRFDGSFKRWEREALKRQRALEREAKEQAKLSALAQARFQVAENENAIELLLSVHRQQSSPVDWQRLAATLPPHRPGRRARHEIAAHLRFASSLEQTEAAERLQVIEESCAADDAEHEANTAAHGRDVEAWRWLQGVCRRVLAGDLAAYEQVLAELSPLSELGHLGCSPTLTIHNPRTVSCDLQVHARDVVPSEIKSLTSTGKLTVKDMPKARFHEIYQDYVCGCALRTARELFAVLPFDIVLVTGRVPYVDMSDGTRSMLPILSVAFTREACAKLDYDRIDASDTVETFLHRGDAKASKKSGEFTPITPLLPSDAGPAKSRATDVASARSNLRLLRNSIRELLRLPALDEAASDASGVST